MSVSINSINLKDEETIDFRQVLLDEDPTVRSIDINQIDGSFITTEPLTEGGKIFIYPQSPNNPKYNINSYSQLTGYGILSMPTDARFNYINGTIWVADTGNSKVIRINVSDYSVSKIIKDIVLPHSVIPDVNSGGVFIKAFSDINTGVLYHYDKNGSLIELLEYPCDLGRLSTDIEASESFINDLPSSNSMAYDHVRSRLWWVSGSYVYMLDVKNKQVVENDLSIDYSITRSVEVELSSGNAFVVVKDPSSDWNIVQIFRDNNYVFCNAYIDEDIQSESSEDTQIGSIVGFGINNYGQITVPSGNDYIAISGGIYHSLALKSDGSIVGWGRNNDGQAVPPSGNDYIALSGGGFHSLALKSDGSIVGFGINNYGQITPPSGNDYTAIEAGNYHSLALKSDGSIVGCGYNVDGQAVPPSGNDYIAISAGAEHSLALKSDGSIVGWGRNDYGQAVPPSGNDYIAISGCGLHSLALKSDGSIVGWGRNDYGQITVPSGNDYTAISGGHSYSLALQII